MSRLSCEGYRHNKTLLLYCDSPELVKAVCGIVVWDAEQQVVLSKNSLHTKPHP